MMNNQIGSSFYRDASRIILSRSAGDDFAEYHDRNRFPPELEREYISDLNERSVGLVRDFLLLVIPIYVAFAILDRYALPITYRFAWVIRGVFVGMMVFSIVNIGKAFIRKRLVVYSTMLATLCGYSVWLMIAGADISEPGSVLYGVGLILVITGVFTLGGDTRVAQWGAWSIVLAYVASGAYQQLVLRRGHEFLTFFIMSFFLIQMTVLGTVSGRFLGRANRNNFLQRRVIEEQKAVEEELHAQTEMLLLNVLPAPIAERLKQGEKVADYFDQASILFADVVDFTPFSADLDPQELVDVLNEIFTHFDVLIGKHNLEKIKTIGDCYMVAAGVPIVRDDHALTLTHVAMEMMNYFDSRTFADHKLELRIGINSGPVVAGVIGRRKFIYDLWGDTVNTASRMESHGQPCCIQITESTYNLVEDYFVCEPQGNKYIKGKGEMPVWHITGLRPGKEMEREIGVRVALPE